MTNDSFRFSFKVSGIERKKVAAVIANEHIGVGEVTYAGAPTFQYHIGGWAIDRNGIVTTPEMGIKEEHVTLRQVLDALTIAGAKAEGSLTVTLPMEGHNGNTLRNLANLIWSKQKLIQKALGREQDIVKEGLVKAINAVPIDSLEDFLRVVKEAIYAGEIEENSD